MTRGATAVSADLFARVDDLRSGRTPFVLATVVRAERPTSARPGDRAVVLPDGTIEGFVGGECAASTVRLEGLRLLRDGESTLLRITPSAGRDDPAPREPVEGLVTVDNPCLSGGTLEIFLEAVVPPTVVLVLGEGPMARALARVGAALDYDVRAVDPADPGAPAPADTAALVVASHGHEEAAALSAALDAGVPYVALVASRRRGATVLGALGPAARERVHTPAGLDLGARTPAEIALSIYAELVAGREHDVTAAVLDAAARDRTSIGHDPTEDDGSEALDPICGMAVARTAASPSVVVGGTTHWFCGAGCRQAFLAREPA